MKKNMAIFGTTLAIILLIALVFHGYFFYIFSQDSITISKSVVYLEPKGEEFLSLVVTAHKAPLSSMKSYLYASDWLTARTTSFREKGATLYYNGINSDGIIFSATPTQVRAGFCYVWDRKSSSSFITNYNSILNEYMAHKNNVALSDRIIDFDLKTGKPILKSRKSGIKYF